MFLSAYCTQWCSPSAASVVQRRQWLTNWVSAAWPYTLTWRSEDLSIITNSGSLLVGYLRIGERIVDQRKLQLLWQKYREPWRLMLTSVFITDFFVLGAQHDGSYTYCLIYVQVRLWWSYKISYTIPIASSGKGSEDGLTAEHSMGSLHIRSQFK